MIVLKECNSYLKKFYESNDVVDNTQLLFMEDGVFSLEAIDFGIKCLTNGKVKDIVGYQEKILKFGGHVLIPHIHKLLINQAQSSNTSLNPGLRALLYPVFKVAIKTMPLIIGQL